ncbi:MAG: hypothetical protein KBG00_10275 [Rhodoferax sp.]|uniref:hypothetical protein n=1 Tax=Rhodoferax sp. TaxID=50421 RepID=UPI001B6DC1DE|nr:hypothetical protein [Rhodoferax sp.]MBP9149155.1 hypothetical protein [Rhodoferax sp.]MBP9735654.1 hypothetical protein [Rhodoferax sp.]
MSSVLVYNDPNVIAAGRDAQLAAAAPILLKVKRTDVVVSYGWPAKMTRVLRDRVKNPQA